MGDGGIDTTQFSTCGIDENGQVNPRIRGLALVFATIFTITVSIMMVNILIAIMSSSYDRLSQRGKAQVLLNQAELISEYSMTIAIQSAQDKAAQHLGHSVQSGINAKILYIMNIVR